MKQGLWILLAVLGMGMTGCFSDEEMSLPDPENTESFRHVGPQCAPGFSKLADNLTACPADRTCETLEDGTICVERLIDTTGGAGINCDAGWITVSQAEFTNKDNPICFKILEDEDEIENVEEMYDELPKDGDGKLTKYFCKKGNIEGRYCRHVPPTKIDSLIVVVPGQYCTTEQSNPSSDTLRVHIIDVGQGDAIWIQTPDNKNILIDGGDGGAYGKTAGGPIVVDYMTFHGFPPNSTLDGIILTHPHADHFGGLPSVINSYKFSNYIDPMEIGWKEPASYETWVNKVIAKLPRENIYMPAGEAFDVGGPMPEEVFGSKVQTEYLFSRSTFASANGNTSNPNTASIVFRLTYAGHSFLFTGDATNVDEAEILTKAPDKLEANFLKACHHGSSTSSTPAFLNAIWNNIPFGERYGFISSGRTAFSGTIIPDPNVVQRFKEMVGENNLFATSVGDDAKRESETYRDDNILIVVKPDGSYYACYNGTN